MRSGLALLVIVASALAAAGAAQTSSQESSRVAATVAAVYDGDTLGVAGGMRVRLVQIDTPELGSGECHSRASARALRRLVPPGTHVGLEADRRLDGVDSYGRLLRYVWRGGLNVNLELVRRGAATVWLYRGERGKYASRLLAAGRRARAERRGLWGACSAVWDPYGPATTAPRTRRGGGPSRCDPSYPTVCIRSPPPDLDCADVRYSRFRVVGSDPHRFDGDHDGVGCEAR